MDGEVGEEFVFWDVDWSVVLRILTTGDQLSFVRGRSVQDTRMDLATARGRFEGLKLAVMDWHAKQVLYGVYSQLLWKTSSKGEKGTLSQLAGVIKGMNIPKDPHNNLHAWEPFFESVTTAHIIAAAVHHWGFTTSPSSSLGKGTLEVSGEPTRNWPLTASGGLASLDYEQVLAVVAQFLDAYVPVVPELPTEDMFDASGWGLASSEKRPKGVHKKYDGVWRAASQQAADQRPDDDSIHEYASCVMWLGLFMMGWKDAVREGDGDRVLRNW